MKALKIAGISIPIIGLTLVGIIYLTFRDTCNDKLTFKSIDAQIQGFESGSSSILKFKWISNIDLPIDYYQQINLLTRKDEIITWGFKSNNHLINNIYVYNRNEIHLSLNNIELLNSNYLEISLGFPDREEYCDCSHPGRPDRYILNLKMKLNFKSDGVIKIKDFQWKEVVDKGGI